MTMSVNFRVLMVICGNVVSGSEIYKSQLPAEFTVTND